MSCITLLSLFEAGRIVATQGVMRDVDPESLLQGLERHLTGDWGDLDVRDRRQNDLALQYGVRLFSRYRSPGGSYFWIITEHDRSITTVMLPEEY